jgi:hypothetical protein
MNGQPAMISSIWKPSIDAVEGIDGLCRIYASRTNRDADYTCIKRSVEKSLIITFFIAKVRRQSIKSKATGAGECVRLLKVATTTIYGDGTLQKIR